MWWSINTAKGSRNWSRALLACAGIAIVAVHPGSAQVTELRVPDSPVVAGSTAAIQTAGTGDGTLYLMSPAHSRKQQVRLGQEIELHPDELRRAGRYTAILCSATCRSASFYIAPAEPAKLSFLVHPSRVAVGRGDAISGTALSFDRFDNLVLTPKTVVFRVSAGDAKAVMSREALTQYGVAWFRADSGNRAGLLQVSVALGSLSARRAVQQVASDPCNLRISGRPTAKGIVVETDPVRDCAGNPVPDGTIVTFTLTDAAGKSTIDAPIKQGVARTQIVSSGPSRVTVASGVVMGNELRLGGAP